MEGSHRKRTPELWEALPLDIIDLIIAKILDDPPFPSLHRLCLVCPRWRAALLSTPYLVYLNSHFELAVFHSKRSVWENVSLQFCQDQLPELQVRHLGLCSSWGGLLILSDISSGSGSGEVIVCNPLTRRCWKRPAPPKRLSARVAMAAIWQVCINNEREVTHRLCSSLSLTRVLIIHAEVTGQYAVGMLCELEVNRILAFLVRRGEQTKQLVTPYSAENLSFLVNGDALQISRAVNLGYQMLSENFAVLAFDSDRMEFLSYRILEEDPHLEAGQSHRRQLFARIINGKRLELFEIVGSGSDAKITFPLSLSSVCRFLVRRIPVELLSAASQSVRSATDVIVIYIGQEDVVYYVAEISLELENGSTATIMAVWMHKPLNLVSDWMRCPPRADAGEEEGFDFQIYQPSFEGPVKVPLPSSFDRP